MRTKVYLSKWSYINSFLGLTRQISDFKLLYNSLKEKYRKLKNFCSKIRLMPPYLCLIIIDKYVAIVQAGQNPWFCRVNIDGFDSV